MIFIVICLCGVSFALMYRDTYKNNKESKINRLVICYSILATIAVVIITCVLELKFVNNSFLFNIKRVGILAILWAVAYIDAKSYRIPNEFIVFGLILRVALLPFEFIFTEGDVLAVILADLIAAAALFVAAALCKMCIKNSIGSGDIKLFIVMGLFLGLDGIWSAIFMSLIVSFFIALYLLIRKKKTRKDSIPFGPAVAAGTFISVFFSGM